MVHAFMVFTEETELTHKFLMETAHPKTPVGNSGLQQWFPNSKLIGISSIID